MRLFLLAFFLLLSVQTTAGFAREPDADEIELRETPQKLFDRLRGSLALPAQPLSNTEEFAALAATQGLSASEYSRQLAFLARASLQPDVLNPNRPEELGLINASLLQSATSPYEMAMALMLKGRTLARLEQQYTSAIDLFIQSLTTLEHSQSNESQWLRLNLYQQLGRLYLFINQHATALVYLQNYRELTYRLRSHYLIADAEADLAMYYNKQQEMSEALQHYSEALRLSHRDDHPFQWAYLQLQLARLYRDLGQASEALSHAHAAAESYGKLGSNNYLSSTQTVIAMIHAGNGEWNKAIDYFLNAQQLDKRSNNFSALARNYHNLGEAYGKIGEWDTAISYLVQANQMFNERHLEHFLVYNEELLADSYCQLKRWQECLHHAELALTLAKQQQLDEVQISAFEHKITAARAAEDWQTVVDYQAAIMALQQSSKNTKTSQSPPVSGLAEQQLKLDLQSKIQQLQAANDTVQQRTLAIAGLLALSLPLLVLLGRARRSRLMLKDRVAQLQQTLTQDAVTGLPGLIAFQTVIGKDCRALALLRKADLCESDLKLGHKRLGERARHTVAALEQIPGLKAFQLRPGLLALALTETMSAPETLLTRLREQLLTIDGPLQLSVINLPLLSVPALDIPTDIHVEVLLMAMAGAQSMDEGTDIYVALRALDFTPSAVFSHPLYLQLAKSIDRGLIRVDTNGNRSRLSWPEWPCPEPPAPETADDAVLAR